MKTKKQNYEGANFASKSVAGAVDRLKSSPSSSSLQEEWSNWSGDFDNWKDSHRNKIGDSSVLIDRQKQK